MKRIPVDEFFAQGENGLRELSGTTGEIVLTKDGAPVARLQPIPKPEGENVPGKLRHTVVHMGDIVSPLGADMWEAAR